MIVDSGVLFLGHAVYSVECSLPRLNAV